MSIIQALAGLFSSYQSPYAGSVIMYLIIFLPILAFLAIMSRYISTLEQTLTNISVQNRTMRPKQVWLLCIPVFGFFWHYVVVKRISESIQHEYAGMRQYNKDTTTYQVGRAMCTASICMFVPLISSMAILVTIVCFIIYWARINSYKDKLNPFSS